MKRSAALLTTWAVAMGAPTLFLAEPILACNPIIKTCDTDPHSIEIGGETTWKLPLGLGPGGSAPWYAYGISTLCPGNNSKEPGHDDLCNAAQIYCDTSPYGGDGPAAYVFRRLAGSDDPWERAAVTCWPELVPGPRTPTMGDVQNAFHRTPFAKPLIGMQPPDGRTLIRLDNYFAMKWSEQGYEPEEVDSLNPADWFGLTVRIKPQFKSVVYDFGDGTSFGPTTDLGGPYPTGNIVKAYTDAGVYTTQIHATLTGQVSLNGSEWIDIPGQADLDGPVTPLTVLTADNRLYASGG